MGKTLRSAHAHAEGRRSPADRYLDPELSWLEWCRRVLARAADRELPLLERVRGVALFARSLDRFYQRRVARLREPRRTRAAPRGLDGSSAHEQLQRIHARVRELVGLQEELFERELRKALAERGIELTAWEGLRESERRELSERFAEETFPLLTPLAVDPAQPFPRVPDPALQLGVLLREGGAERLGRVEVPRRLPRFLAVSGERFVPAEQVIAAHLDGLSPGLDGLFPGRERVCQHAFRVTPGGVRLEVEAGMHPRMLERLVRALGLEERHVQPCRAPLDLGGLAQLCALDRPELELEAWVPVEPRRAPAGAGRAGAGGGASGARAEGPLFAALDGGDLLVHPPYESVRSSADAFLRDAARDPNVLAIKHSLPRSAGPESPDRRALVEAAQAGKEVVALVERAEGADASVPSGDFDGWAGREWARPLTEAGVHVVYGRPGREVQGALSLVVRYGSGGVRRYCRLGTGSHEPLAARPREDLVLLTAAPEIGADLGRLFNHLTGYGEEGRYRRLRVAPGGLRPALLQLVRDEILAGDGEIAFQVNALSDKALIDALYEASCAGVRIDLLVRGVCCLRPGVPGLSEHIRVRSIVGRHLEHARILRFGSRARGRRHFLGCADLDARSLDERVAVVTPVEDARARARLDEIFEVKLDPAARAWQLWPDGSWQPSPAEGGFCSQRRLQERAEARASIAARG